MTHAGATPKPPRKLKNGADAHQLTPEDCRKGQARAAELKREAAKSFRERLAERLDEKADEIITTLLAAGAEDWRATVAALDQGFGKPTERTEITGADGGPVAVDTSAKITDVLAMLKAVGADGEDSGDSSGASGAGLPAA